MKTTYIVPSGTSMGLSVEAIRSGHHILIAGSTGSGKSVLLSHLMQYLMLNATPFDEERGARFILCDVKRVELSRYKDLPHTIEFCRTASECLNGLRLASNIIEQRLADMEKRGAVMWQGSTVYVIIDELADLVLSDLGKNIKRYIQHIGQVGRACKVRLICCTQAPSRKVIPAEIVLNFNYRIGLHCNSPIESRQIVGNNLAASLDLYGECVVASPSETFITDIPMIDYKDHARIITAWNEQANSEKGLKHLLTSLKTYFTE